MKKTFFLWTVLLLAAFSAQFAHGDMGYSCSVLSSPQPVTPGSMIVGKVQCVDVASANLSALSQVAPRIVYEGFLSSAQLKQLAPQGATAASVSPSLLTAFIGNGLTLYNSDGSAKIPNPVTRNLPLCSWTPQTPAGSTVMTEGYGDYFDLDTTNAACAPAEVSLPQTFTAFCGGSVDCGTGSVQYVACEASGNGTCPTADQCAKLGAPFGTSPANKPSHAPSGLLQFPGGNGVCSTANGGCLAASCDSDSACSADSCVKKARAHASVKEVPYPSAGSSKAGSNAGAAGN